MTYTFKLARRLAVSRNYSMLPVLLVLAACTGDDATAPEAPTETPTAGAELVPVAVKVSPSSVTLETNQLIQFRAQGTNSAGDSVGAAVTWRTTGGTILPDGRFSAAAIGTYTVVGLNRVRGRLQLDTSIVHVVRRQTQLATIEVSPTTVTLAPGVSQTFTALGRLLGGSVVPIGVNWTATGGSIDGGGNYLAGDTAGTYRVTATNTAGTLADTVTVTITAPPTPPPPTGNTLAKVILMPWGGITLAPGATYQWRVFGRTADGDSVSVNATFSATGGTITSGGLYTAGSTAGKYRVVAKAGSLADTSSLTVSSPLGGGTVTGIPFGPFNTYASGSSLKPNAGMFSLSHDPTSAHDILRRINSARQMGIHLSLAIVGGAHSGYLTDGVFDRGKWTARLQTFNTPEIRQAVAAAVSDGTVVIGNVMDEPFHPSWGPSGTLTKARIDSLCGEMKAVFPTLPVGPTHDWDDFEPTKSYRVCDYFLSQYRWSKGPVSRFRDASLAIAKRDGHAVGFSMNILNGGRPDKDRDGVWECPTSGVADSLLTGGFGTGGVYCAMTAEQVREFGRALGPQGCVFTMWRYDEEFMAKPENIQAFRDLAALLANSPGKSCRRL